jgi:hypothetical protein
LLIVGYWIIVNVFMWYWELSTTCIVYFAFFLKFYFFLSFLIYSWILFRRKSTYLDISKFWVA